MSEITLRPRARRSAAAALALPLGATSAAAAVAVAPAAQAATTTFTVQAGQGWWQVSQATGVPMTTLAALNGLTVESELQPGQVLKTSGAAPAPSSSAAGTYTVKAGEGWYAVSRNSGASLATLFAANGMSITTELYPGQVLKTSGTAASAPATPSTTGTYTVKPGDGWYAVERNTGVSVSALLTLNNASLTTELYPGQVLKTSLSATPTSVVTPAPAPAPIVGKQAAIDFAIAKVKDPNTYYAWGGNGPYGFDCSGLMQQAYLKAGIALPRTSAGQYAGAKSYVPLSQAQPGDLVFWADSSTGRIYHVAMYIGGGQVAHALNPTDGLLITSTDIMTSNLVSMAARY